MLGYPNKGKIQSRTAATQGILGAHRRYDLHYHSTSSRTRRLECTQPRRSGASGRIPCIRSAKARAARRPAQGKGRNRKVPLDRGCLRERAKQQGARLRLRQGLRLSQGDASGVWTRREGHTCASGQGVQVVVRVIVWPGRGRPVALHLREQLPTDKTRQREDTTSREVSRCGSPRVVFGSPMTRHDESRGEPLRLASQCGPPSRAAADGQNPTNRHR